MPQFCAVVGCGVNNARDKDCSFYRFPSEKDNRGKINEQAHTDTVIEQQQPSTSKDVDLSNTAEEEISQCTEEKLNSALLAANTEIYNLREKLEASDKYITEHSGFLDYLLPGDLVLTDRGFTVQNTVRLYMAEVLTPAFLKGQKQLHPKEVEATRKIAHVRIHVERVIGTLRQKYKILSHTIPISTLSKTDEVSVIDKIVTICCALTNISPSVVPLL
ncbi:hypothetical protein CBL_11552 [Carabus blaptoides fortunei]